MPNQHSNASPRSFGYGVTQCPICSCTEHVFVENVFDDRYGCPDPFALVGCKACGHLMTSPCLAEEELARLYSTYYPRKQVDTAALEAASSKVAGTWARLERWLAGTDNQGQYCLRSGEVVLDVGCGSGQSLMEVERLGGEAFGIEADPNVRSTAEKLGLRIHIGSVYDQPFPDARFDLIVLNQVIEHIPQPGKALDALKERLKPGGRIALAFPNRGSVWCRLFKSKWINWHVPYHLHHFDAQGFEALARRHGYRVLRRRTITPNLWTILQLHALRQLPELGMPNTSWDASGAIEETNTRLALPYKTTRRVLGPIFRRIKTTGLVLMNRMIDLAGYGDSVLIELGIED